jgi:hypothetical protein
MGRLLILVLLAALAVFVAGPLWLAAQVYMLAASALWAVVILGEDIRPGARPAMARSGWFWVVTVR